MTDDNLRKHHMHAIGAPLFSPCCAQTPRKIENEQCNRILTQSSLHLASHCSIIPRIIFF